MQTIDATPPHKNYRAYRGNPDGTLSPVPPPKRIRDARDIDRVESLLASYKVFWTLPGNRRALARAVSVIGDSHEDGTPAILGPGTVTILAHYLANKGLEEQRRRLLGPDSE